MGEGNGHNAIDSLIFMNDLQQFAVPSTTAVSTTVPSSEDFQQNRTQNLANLVGSIGSPQGLSEEELLEIVMSTSPVGASIRGGKMAKSTLEQLLGLSKKLGLKPPKGITAGNLRGKGLENILNRNASSVDKIKYAKAREAYDSVLKKHKIADPDKQGMVDPVTALLNYFSKN